MNETSSDKLGTASNGLKIYFAADHAGFELKNALLSFVRDELQYEVEDCGAYELDPSDDYPDYVSIAAKKVSEDPGGVRAIVLGASGQGEAIVANRFQYVRAVVYYGTPAHSQTDAQGERIDMISSTRIHNNANVLSIGARFTDVEQVKKAVRLWLLTDFPGEVRHLRRIEAIETVTE